MPETAPQKGTKAKGMDLNKWKQVESTRLKAKNLTELLLTKSSPTRNKCRLTINLHTVVQVRKWRVSWGAGARLIVVQSVSSVAQSCLTLDPMDCSMPGLPVHRQFPEFTQTHVH